MSPKERYDWWAAEGRPERLRPLSRLADRLVRDPYLATHEITVFSAGVDLDREVVTAEVAAADQAAATALIRERYGDCVEVEVTAAAAFEFADVAWTCWIPGAAVNELSVWLLDTTDGSELRATVSETDDDVVITLRARRWQGASAMAGYPVERRIKLAAPLAGRAVVDGSTGEPRPRCRPG